MGFSLFQALGGAAEQYTKNFEKERDNALEMMRETSRYLIQTADEAIKERAPKQKELLEIGKQLQTLQLDPAQIEGVLGLGLEQAKKFAQTAPAVVQAIRTSKENARPDFSARDLVTLANPEVTGKPLEESVRGIMGIYRPDLEATDVAIPAGSAGYTQRMMAGANDQILKATGMTEAEIRAYQRGDLEYSDTPAVTIAPEFYAVESADVRSALAEANIKEGQAIITDAEAGVAHELAGFKVTREGLEIDSVRETITKQQNENSDWATRIDQRDKKFEADMKAAETAQDDADTNLRMLKIKEQYYEDTIKAQLDYEKARAKKEGAVESKDPAELTKKYVDTYAKSFAQAMGNSTVSKNLRFIDTGVGTYRVAWKGSDEARVQYDNEVKTFTNTFLSSVFMSDGNRKEAFAAVQQMNPEWKNSIESTDSIASLKQNPYKPYRVYDEDTQSNHIVYFDPSANNGKGDMVSVTQY